MSTAQICECFLNTDFVIEFDYTVTSPGYPARTYGLPEDCYPAEGIEYQIDDIRLFLDGSNEPLDIPLWMQGILMDELLTSQKAYDAVRENEDNGEW